MRGRIGAYAGFQLKDYFTGRAIVGVLVTAAVASGYAIRRGLTLSAFDSSGGFEARDQLQQAFEFVLAVFAFTAAVLAAHGLIGRHRARGYDHVIFSRPVSPARYYLQSFILAGLGSTIVGAIAAQLYAATVHPVSVVGVGAYVALVWLAMGSLAFLLSTVTRLHLVVLAGLIGAAFALDAFVGTLAMGGGRSVLELAQYLLPPAHVLAALRDPFARGLVIDARSIAWPLAFGSACLLLSLLMLRRRPFGS